MRLAEEDAEVEDLPSAFSMTLKGVGSDEEEVKLEWDCVEVSCWMVMLEGNS